MRRFAMIMLCASSPAFAADPFNLACQGNKTVVSGGPATPYAFTVQIDPSRKQWCWDKCERVLPIIDAGADKLVLADDAILNTRQETTIDGWFDRKSRAFHYSLYQLRPDEQYLKVDATCTEQPFTALPAK